MPTAIDSLQSRGWLSKLPRPFQAAVLDRCQVRKVETGVAIYRIGDPPTGMVGIGDGTVAVEAAPAERDPRTILLGRPGTWFGLRAVVTGRPRSIGLIARSPVDFLFLPAAAIDEIVRDDPPAWRHFARVELIELAPLATICGDLIRRFPDERVVAALLHFGGCRFAAPVEGPIDLDIGQDDVAWIANVGRTTAGAVLRELEMTGQVALAYRRIRLLSPDALRAASARDPPIGRRAPFMSPRDKSYRAPAANQTPPAASSSGRDPRQSEVQVKLLVTTVVLLSLLAPFSARADGAKVMLNADTLDAVRKVAPALEKYAQGPLADLWRRPGLALRDRSIVTVAAMIARNQTADIAGQLERALDNGVKPAEISEIITHLAFYSGWSNAMAATAAAKDVFARRNIGLDQLAAASPPLLALNEAQEANRANRVGQQFGATFPGVVQYTTDVLFRDLWLRPDLAPRDRSLVTISALVAAGQMAQLTAHLNLGMDNGLTRTEAAEAITHLAFYVGWPNVFSAMPVAKDVFEKRPK